MEPRGAHQPSGFGNSDCCHKTTSISTENCLALVVAIQVLARAASEVEIDTHVQND